MAMDDHLKIYVSYIRCFHFEDVSAVKAHCSMFCLTLKDVVIKTENQILQWISKIAFQLI